MPPKTTTRTDHKAYEFPNKKISPNVNVSATPSSRGFAAFAFVAVNGGVGVAAGEVLGVVVGDDGLPVFEGFGFGEGFADDEMLGVEGGVFNAEFSHEGAGAVGAVERFGETIVFEDDIALLEEGGRRRQFFPLGESAD